MVQYRFVRVIPLLSKKHLEEFIISEDYFLQDYHWTENSGLPCSASCNKSIIEVSEHNNKLLNISDKDAELHNENSSMEIINEQTFLFPDLEFCCATIFFQRDDPVHINYFSKMDGQLFSVFALELSRSSLFRKAVIDSLFERYYNKGKAYKVKNTKCPSCGHTWINITIGIYLSWPRHCVLDKAGCRIPGGKLCCCEDNCSCSVPCHHFSKKRGNHLNEDGKWQDPELEEFPLQDNFKNVIAGVNLGYLLSLLVANGKRIRMLVNERCEIENAMSWLSTLGGAYSSLGDEFLYHARQAQKVSLQQFKLALMLQDPLAVSRCKIYFAMSLVQQGYYKEAKCIVRKQYKYALLDQGCLDFRLANMCKAVWNKIKHLQNEAKQQLES